MSKTYFKLRNDRGNITFTRFAGGPYGRSLQITVGKAYNFKPDILSNFMCHMCITKDEAKELRDALTQFISGDTSDSCRTSYVDHRSEKVRKIEDTPEGCCPDCHSHLDGCYCHSCQASTKYKYYEQTKSIS